ncbi:hypothetical protein B0H13DRAFT_1901783 [Mycena leptocephala]|nr:hypothetical protein B0H13DRAFT_1901783 [Mycena leptocephala]
MNATYLGTCAQEAVQQNWSSCFTSVPLAKTLVLIGYIYSRRTYVLELVRTLMFMHNEHGDRRQGPMQYSKAASRIMQEACQLAFPLGDSANSTTLPGGNSSLPATTPSSSDLPVETSDQPVQSSSSSVETSDLPVEIEECDKPSEDSEESSS